MEFFDSKPVSRSTFYELWSKLARSEDALGKGGRRLENAEADSIDPKVKSLVASRPYAVAHIDHWKCDLFVVVGEINGKKITRRPWLTAMVDAFSGEVLAIWLSFSDPSKRSCTMVIRDCVRRHGRLPELIVTDCGSDFKSAHFLVMLATLGVVRCERPPEDPRFGREVERLFGQFKERFARGLPGYGLSLEKSRAVSGSFKSEKRASLSLLDAFEVLEAYVFHGYNHSPKPGEISSRYALRDRSLRRYPHSGRITDWNLKLLVATSIEAPGTGYKLWPGHGLHVDDKWYTCDRLNLYRGYKKDLIVRLEPYADSIVYVCVDGKWLVCMNSSARLQFSTAEMSFIMASSERRDLKALRKELENEQTRCAAAIVDDTLKRIAERKESHPRTDTPDRDDDDDIETQAPWSQLNFDDIAPCENEKR